MAEKEPTVLTLFQKGYQPNLDRLQRRTHRNSRPAMEPYVYKSIERIRILNIHRFEPELVASLEDHPIDNLPDYHAISYAWVHENPPTSFIICDGRILPVTSDLHEGLRCISKVKGCQRLWVDAICINQNDDTEKAHQVANMYRVYQNATSLYVWLGPAANDSDLAMGDITSVSDKFENIDFYNLGLRQDIREWFKGIYSRFHAEALEHLFRRAWFQRLWVFQEYLLSREPTFFCGLAERDGSSFLEFAMMLFYIADVNISDVSIELMPIITELGYGKDKWNNRSTSHSFLGFVETGRRRLVTEPLDRIYALLGLAQGRNAIYRSQIVIDYSESNKASFLETFVKFSKIALIHEPFLDLLSCTDSKDRPESLPSWCPNFNSIKATGGLSYLYNAGITSGDYRLREGARRTDDSESSRNLDYRRDEKALVSFSDSSNVIKMWGAIVGVISRTSEAFPEYNGPFHWKLESVRTLSWLEDAWTLYAAHARPSPIQGTTSIDSFPRVMLGNISIDRSETPCSQKDLEAFEAFRRGIKFYAKQVGQAELPRMDEQELKDFGFCREACPLFISTWRNRRMFITADGRVGFASRHVRLGDLVCILYSGYTAYILRKVPDRDTYTFISEAYADGLMQGEAFDMTDKGEATEELFCIE